MTLAIAMLAALALHPAGLLAFGALALGAACLGTLFFPLGALTSDAQTKLLMGDFTPITVSGAINPHQAGRYRINKAGVAAMTLAAPTVGSEDGLLLQITSTTANAHTVTATGLYRTGAAAVNLATYAAQIGASMILEALDGKWYVVSSVGVTFS